MECIWRSNLSKTTRKGWSGIFKRFQKGVSYISMFSWLVFMHPKTSYGPTSLRKDFLLIFRYPEVPIMALSGNAPPSRQLKIREFLQLKKPFRCSAASTKSFPVMFAPRVVWFWFSVLFFNIHITCLPGLNSTASLDHFSKHDVFVLGALDFLGQIQAHTVKGLVEDWVLLGTPPILDDPLSFLGLAQEVTGTDGRIGVMGLKAPN